MCYLWDNLEYFTYSTYLLISFLLSPYYIQDGFPGYVQQLRYLDKDISAKGK